MHGLGVMKIFFGVHKNSELNRSLNIQAMGCTRNCSWHVRDLTISPLNNNISSFLMIVRE